MVTFQEHEGLLLAREHGDPGEAAKRLINDAAVPTLGHARAGLGDVWVDEQDRLVGRFSSRSKADLGALAERVRSGLEGALDEVEWLEVGNVRDRWAFRGQATEPDPARRNPRAETWERIRRVDADPAERSRGDAPDP